MDWFERLTGFREVSREHTRRQLWVDGPRLRSRADGRSHGIGRFELVSLQALRAQAAAPAAAVSAAVAGPARRSSLRTVQADVRALHRDPACAGALFQVASQFNMLEMADPSLTPEDGVTRYQDDGTQGPTCAIAAGAGTVYRNDFVPVGDGFGQTRDRQLDGLADLGAALAQACGRSVQTLWAMRNGYALCSAEGLVAINRVLETASAAEVDTLRGRLCIGLHLDVEVTDGDPASRPAGAQVVSQAYCSALPVAYSRVPEVLWQPFAQLVLEAAYEATLLAACLQARRGGSNTVLLTRVGGGVFGNDDAWIDAAIGRALGLARDAGLDVVFVSHGRPHASSLAWVQASRGGLTGPP